MLAYDLALVDFEALQEAGPAGTSQAVGTATAATAARAASAPAVAAGTR